MSETGLAARLGAFAVETSLDAIPDAIRRSGSLALLNVVGTALGSAADPAVAGAARVMALLSGPATATVIGRDGRLDASGAAFVNAIGMNLFDYDDTHMSTIIHPSAPVAPVVLALGEERDVTGAEAMRAFLVGAEIACRVGDAVSPGHYARGWHITSTCGTFGAAAAASCLLGLDARRCGHALGVAASLAGGTIENLPTAGKNASVGAAARNGILAALLAREGYEAAPAAIEGRLGWARACGDAPDVARALHGLGEDWALALNALKPYPAGIVFHSEIDACFALREAYGLSAADIAAVTVRGDALFIARGDRMVATAGDARVSLRHAAAAVFVRGAAGVPEFALSCVEDPAVAAFRERVTGLRDDSLPPGAVSVTVETVDGRRLSETVLHPRGSLAHPMSRADVEAKVRALAGPAWALRIDTVIDLAASLERQPSVHPLMRALSGEAGSSS